MKKRAKLFMITAMTAFGTLGVFVRLIPLASSVIALARAILASLLLGGVLLFQKKRPSLGASPRNIILLAVSGAAIGFNWILLFEAYRYTSVAAATLCYYFAPVLVTVLCPLIFREKISPVGIICFITASIGTVLMTVGADVANGSDHLLGAILALGAAVLYASVILMNKSLIGIGNTERTLMQFICSAAVLLPYVLLRGDITTFSIGAVGYIALVTIGIFHTGVAYLMYFSSVSSLSGTEVAIYSYTDPLVAVVLSVTVLGESLSVMQIIGGISVLLSTLACELVPAALARRAKKRGEGGQNTQRGRG